MFFHDLKTLRLIFALIFKIATLNLIPAAVAWMLITLSLVLMFLKILGLIFALIFKTGNINTLILALLQKT